jgi:cobalt-precorrin-7 (C5)-methyltransferase
LKQINVIGMGPGSEKYVLPISREMIERSEVLIAAKRYLERYCSDNQEGILLTMPYEQIVKWIDEHRMNREISILVSGDASFYSFTSFLKRHFQRSELHILPGISSLQYLYARLGLSYENSLLTSLHGRSPDRWHRFNQYTTVGILTDQDWNPAKIAQEISVRRLPFSTLYVGENLSYENENIVKMTVEEGMLYNTSHINAVVVSNE